MKISLKNNRANYLMRLEFLTLTLEIHKTVFFGRLYNYDQKFCGFDFPCFRAYIKQ